MITFFSISMGYCILVVLGLNHLSNKATKLPNNLRIVLPALVYTWLIVFSCRTMNRNAVWKTREALFRLEFLNSYSCIYSICDRILAMIPINSRYLLSSTLKCQLLSVNENQSPYDDMQYQYIMY